KTEPLELTLEMVTLLFPVFVITSLFEVVFPTCTLPKLTDVGFAASLPEPPPPRLLEPATATAMTGLEALLWYVIRPFGDCVSVGAYTNCTVTLLPAPRVYGRGSPLGYTLVVLVLELIRMELLPEFLNTTEMAFF